MMRIRYALAAGAFLAFGARTTRAQGASYVPTSTSVGIEVHTLVNLGLVRSAFVGTQPYSRRELARIANEARARLAALRDSAPADPRIATADYAVERIARAARLSASDSGFAAARVEAPLASVAVQVATMDSPWRAIPNGGLMPIDASTNPLAEHTGGQPTADGLTAALETEHLIDLGSHLAIQARIHGVAERERGTGDGTLRARAEELAARSVFSNVAIDLGREHLVWGPGRVASPALSDNADANDLLRVSSDSPFRLPWFLRRLGPTTATVFLSDLGPRYKPSHARLAAYRASVLPQSWFEFGINVLDIQGGNGAPPAIFADRIGDFFPLIDVIFKPSSDWEFSNKLAGGDLTFRIPAARGLELRYDILFDDFDARRLWSTIWQASASQFGITMPRLTSDGSLALTAELHHIGLHVYQHGQFATGVAKNQWLFGDPLGPRGDAGYLVLDWLASAANRVSFTLADERRSNDQWEIVVNDVHSDGYHFVKTADLPEEWRWRGMAHWEGERGPRYSLGVDAGVERVANFNFTKGDSRLNTLLRVTARRRF